MLLVELTLKNIVSFLAILLAVISIYLSRRARRELCRLEHELEEAKKRAQALED